MRTGAYAVALLNLLLLSYFVCQTLHISFCGNSLFHFGRHPEVQRPPSAAAAYPPPQSLARPAEAIFRKGTAAEKSYFLPWIQHDFQLWQPSGITLGMVDEVSRRYRECFGEVFRFQIINDTLWVEHISERHNGWYPAKLGSGALSGKGKIPYGVLAIMDVMRHYPGQVPDLDAVLQTSDFPCMLRSLPNAAAISPPIFGYNSHPTYADIPFPDYSYWGHEYSRLLGSDGQYLHGWEQQFGFLSTKWADVPVSQRIPQAMWRGRTEDPDFPKRDELRRRFNRCEDEIRAQGRDQDADLFNLMEPDVSLHDTCNYRYPMYIESDAWVTNLKQKLACGSILISNRMEYYEWFTRALKPGVHYVEVESADICEDTLRKVKQMNAAFDQAAVRQLGEEQRQQAALRQAAGAGGAGAGRGQQAGGATGQGGIRPFLVGAAQAQEQQQQQQQQQPLLQRPAQESQLLNGTAPWKVGAAGQQFLADHVQMRDVRLYIRDALQQYAALQSFKPQPSWNALCYTGDLLLEQFAFPDYEEDRRVVLGAYPWLDHWAADKCSGRVTRAELAQQLRNP